MKKRNQSTSLKITYKPNHIPEKERNAYIILSCALFYFGTVGLVNDELWIPSRKLTLNPMPDTHLHGETVTYLCCAMFCAVANMVSIVADHYDKRDNEINYKIFSRITQTVGWIFFSISVYLYFTNG